MRLMALDDLPIRLLSHDACLRCCREFDHGQETRVVRGNATARYRAVSIIVCQGCLVDDYDEVQGATIYASDGGPSYMTWPRYCGRLGTAGFLKMSKLSNGVFRVGLHRAQPEVWTSNETAGAKVPVGTMGYTPGYLLYGPMTLFTDAYAEVEIRWCDLRTPEPYVSPAARP